MQNGISDVQDKRTFSFSDEEYTIHEILEEPGISMDWRWDDALCPHCKKKITRKETHQFARIEVLGKTGIAVDDLVLADLIFLGDTYDKRRLLLTAEKAEEVLKKSKIFKKLGKK